MDEASLRALLAEIQANLRAGQFEQAEVGLHRAIAVRPDDGALAMNLAATLASLERLDEALPWHDRATKLRPTDPGAHFNRGKTLLLMRRYEEALSSFDRAGSLVPTYGDAILHAGICRHMLHEDGLALPLLRRAIDLAPGNAVAHLYLGQVLRELGLFDESLRHVQATVALEPNDPDYRYGYGLNLLLHGRWREGFGEAEARWSTPAFAKLLRKMPARRWDGSPLDGNAIYLQPEQGFGDVIQFIRYAPLVAERGGRVIVGCEPSIREIIATVPGVTEALEVVDQPPACECWFPLLSLPWLFETDETTVPANVPYVHADAARVARWLSRLGDDSKLRVGIAWAGSPTHLRDLYRSTTRETMLPLARVEGAQLFSLQKGRGDARGVAPRLNEVADGIVDLAPDLHDFSDTAAAIANLDLVIAVDTAVAHLAGAMGKPVWLLLGYSPDWRWMLHRADSPWYPTMRIFRQTRLHDWTELIRRVATSLQSLAD